MIKKKKIKVLHILPGFATGGAEMVVLNYLRNFKESDSVEIRCVSLTSNQERLYEKIIEDNKLPVQFIDSSRCHNKLFLRILQITKLRSIIHDFRPDCIHLHLAVLNIACIASIGYKCKIFHTFHSDPSYTLNSRARKTYLHYYKKYNITPIALTKEYKKTVENLLPGVVCEMLGNGIDTDKYNGLSKEMLRREYGLSNRYFVIVHVGRFHPAKNHELIIDIFEDVCRVNTDSMLLLIGNGELESSIKEKVMNLGLSNKVWFLEERQDVPQLLSACDCFLFPSLYEGLGIALVEAQAAGLKCVISNKVPKEAIVTNKVISVPLGSSINTWTKAILSEQPTEMPRNNLAYYDNKSVCERLVDIYTIGCNFV